MTPTMIRGLQAMAQADESPQERDIARAKLAEAGVPIDPPRPPAPPAAAAPGPDYGSWWFSSTAGTASTINQTGFVFIRVTTT